MRLPLLACASLLVIACPKPPAPSPVVGLVDLDRVAKATGRDAAYQKEQASAEANLKGQLEKLRDDLTAQLSNIEKAGKPEDKTRIESLRAEAQRNLDAKVAEAQQLSERHKRELVQRFKEEIRPAIRRVAAMKNVAIVLLPDQVFDYTPEVDITDDVIMEWRRAEASTGFTLRTEGQPPLTQGPPQGQNQPPPPTGAQPPPQQQAPH